MGIEVFLKYHQRRVLFYRFLSTEMDPGFSYGPHTSTPAPSKAMPFHHPYWLLSARST
jgi:hypothetical protein